MVVIDKNMVLLLGHNVWQERAISLSLRLGGYRAHVVKDECETLNIVKTMSDAVHCLLVSGTGNRGVLNARLQAFKEHDVCVPVVLLGMSGSELIECQVADEIKEQLQLSTCSYEQLLDCLRL